MKEKGIGGLTLEEALISRMNWMALNGGGGYWPLQGGQPGSLAPLPTQPGEYVHSAPT